MVIMAIRVPRPQGIPGTSCPNHSPLQEIPINGGTVGGGGNKEGPSDPVVPTLSGSGTNVCIP